MVNWKTKVNPVYIQNHDIYNRVLVYNTITGKHFEMGREDLPNTNDIWTGFYIMHNKDYVGVFASNLGPIFFVNSIMYPLAENDWKFIVNDNPVSNEFIFEYNRKAPFRTDYKKVKDVGIHPYADEDFMDFFKWMQSNNNDIAFIKYYTV